MMSNRRGIRRFVALIAAYAVAIQAVLSAIAIAPRVHAAEFSVLCSASDDSGGAQPPAHSDSPMCCVASGCASSGCAAPPAATEIQRNPAVVSVALLASPLDRLAFWPSERPQSSRAPPV
jgi:hypothetical protein